MKRITDTLPRTGLTALAALTALLATGAGSAAHAHTVWLEAEPSEPGTYRVLYGGHEGRLEPYAADKLKSAEAYDDNGTRLAIERVLGADGLVRVRSQGQAAVITLFFDNGIWSRTDGGRSVNKPMNEVPNAIGGVHAVKYHKNLARWSRAALRTWGQAFELLPLDAQAPRAGVPMRVQVLIDGKPAAGIKIASDEDAPGVLTDAAGIASVVPLAGPNKLWAGQRKPVPGNPHFTVYSVEYTLSFSAGAAP